MHRFLLFYCLLLFSVAVNQFAKYFLLIFIRCFKYFSVLCLFRFLLMNILVENFYMICSVFKHFDLIQMKFSHFFLWADVHDVDSMLLQPKMQFWQFFKVEFQYVPGLQQKHSVIFALTCFVAHEQTPLVKLKLGDQHTLQSVALEQDLQPSAHFTKTDRNPFSKSYQ